MLTMRTPTQPYAKPTATAAPIERPNTRSTRDLSTTPTGTAMDTPPRGSAQSSGTLLVPETPEYEAPQVKVKHDMHTCIKQAKHIQRSLHTLKFTNAMEGMREVQKLAAKMKSLVECMSESAGERAEIPTNAEPTTNIIQRMERMESEMRDGMKEMKHQMMEALSEALSKSKTFAEVVATNANANANTIAIRAAHKSTARPTLREYKTETKAEQAKHEITLTAEGAHEEIKELWRR